MQPDDDGDMTTLTQLIEDMANAGYTSGMAAVEDGRLRCFDCHTVSAAVECEVDALRRVEGTSDPADMAVLAAIVCPRCHAKGTAVFKFGPGATPEEAEVLSLLEDRRGRSGAGGTSHPDLRSRPSHT